MAMQRIMILGCPGSGKSTLAEKLGKKLDIEVTYTDMVRFLSGWIARDAQTISNEMQEIQSRSHWIIDGSLSAGLMDHRIERADTFVFLDFPRWLCMLRVIRRAITHYGRVRPNIPEGCKEGFNPEFFKWTWNWKHAARQKTEERLAQAKDTTRIFRLCNPAEVAKFLDEIEKER